MNRAAQSGVLGPVAPNGPEFAEQHRTARDATLGFAKSIERYGDYGWGIYGNAHHEELMNPAVAGVPGGRPSLHRMGCWPTYRVTIFERAFHSAPLR